METERKEKSFVMAIEAVSKDRNGKTNKDFPVPARQTPDVFCRVAPVLRNRRLRIAEGDTHGDGNSGHLKREPYPFQMSDAIPRVRFRVLDNIWTMSRKYKDNLWTKWCKALTTYSQRSLKVLTTLQHVKTLLKRCCNDVIML